MIYFLPWGNSSIASSRLRVHQVAKHIPDSSFSLPETYKRGDVLVCQKNPSFINELRKAKSQGAKVIYDIDDNYFEMPALKDAYFQMVKEADKVVVGAPYLTRYCPGSVFIPDTLDKNTDLVKSDYSLKGLIGWFGYGNNAHYLNNVMQSVVANNFKIRIIATEDALSYIKSDLQCVEFKQWSLETIDSLLIECDLCIFPLNESEVHSQAKGEHKIMKSWSLGLPVVSANIPMYRKVMQEAGIEGIATSSVEWTRLLTLLKNDDMRKEWGNKALQYVKNYYKKEDPVGKWKEVIGSCL